MIKIKTILVGSAMFVPFVMDLLTGNACATMNNDNVFADNSNDSFFRSRLAVITKYRKENVEIKVATTKKSKYWAKSENWKHSLENLDKLHYYAKYNAGEHTKRRELIAKNIIQIVNEDFERTKNMYKSISVNEYLCQVRKEVRASVLGLFNGILVGEYLYHRINDTKKYPGNQSNLSQEFNNILQLVMKMLNQMKVDINGTERCLNGVITDIAKGTSAEEYDFTHDMKCYLEQFWYVCNGKDKNGNVVESVVSKVNEKFHNGNNVQNVNKIQYEVSKPNEMRNISGQVINKISIDNRFDAAPPPYSGSSESTLTDDDLINKIEDHISQTDGKIKGGGLKSLNGNSAELMRLESIYRKQEQIYKADLVKAYKILNDNLDARCRGLKNQGATCYLNAPLQGLASQRKFLLQLFSHVSRRYNELEERSKKNGEDGKFVKVALAFVKTMCQMFINPSKEDYAPVDLSNALQKTGGIFENVNSAGDSKDVFDNIIRILHDALKFKLQKSVQNAAPQSNDNDRNKKFYQFQEDLRSEDKSVIKDYFYFTEEIRYVYDCPQKHQAWNFQQAHFYPFPLIEVLNHKYNCNLRGSNTSKEKKDQFCDSNPVKLEDCFVFMCEPKQIVDMYCESCNGNKNCTCSSTEFFATGGNVMTFVLNRGEGLEFPVRVKIPQVLDKFGHYCTIDRNSHYYLSAVICWQQGGHYTTFSKTSPNGSWFWYNDNLVQDLSKKENSPIRQWFLGMLEGKAVGHFPTILFYTRVDGYEQIAQQSRNNNAQIQNSVNVEMYNKSAINNNFMQGGTQWEKRVILNFNQTIANNTLDIKKLIQQSDLRPNTNRTMGIKNIGATCYMNAVLQCLANIIPLKEQFIKYYDYWRNSKLQTLEQKLTKEFSNVIRNLWNAKGENGGYKPKDFHDLLGASNLQFKDFAANDAKDLILYLLQTFDDTLNGQRTRQRPFCDQSSEISALNFNTEMNGTLDETIMRKLFWSYALPSTKCDSCKTTTYNAQFLHYLDLPMWRIKDYKQKYPMKKVSIYNCLTDYSSPTKLSGNNQFFCQKCNALRDAECKTTIYYSSPVMIFNLDYGQNKKCADGVSGLEIPLDLDMKDFVEVGKSNAKYFLSGVIVHSGKSGSSGHYIFLGRSRPDSDWYEYSDSSVKKITNGGIWLPGKAIGWNISDILPNSKRNVFIVSKNVTPCILVYQRKDLYDPSAMVNNETIPLPKENFQNNNNFGQNVLNMSNNLTPNNNYQMFNNYNNGQRNFYPQGNYQANNLITNGQQFGNSQNFYPQGINQVNNQMMNVQQFGNNMNMFNNMQNINNFNNANNFGQIKNITNSVDNIKQKQLTQDKVFENKLLAGINLSTRQCWNQFGEPYQSKALRGLYNIGATCYMNATLQCLLHIKPLVNELFWMTHSNQQFAYKTEGDVFNDKGKQEHVNEKYRLSRSFTLTALNVYDIRPEMVLDPGSLVKVKGDFEIIEGNAVKKNTTNEYYEPYNFKKTISEMESLFDGNQANDAKDLVNFILMTMHNELNKIQKIQNSGNILFEQRNKLGMFQAFAKDFMSKNQSIISDLFYAANYSQVQCGYCNETSYNFQTYFFSIFPLEEVRKFVADKYDNWNNMQGIGQNSVSLYHCLEYDRKITTMTGQNAMFCNICKQTANTSMSTHLATGPKIWVMIFNRGQGIQYKVQCQFPEYLDASNYIEFKNTGTQYKLIGVITHMGESGQSGHFVATCRGTDGNWYRYNDEFVSRINSFKYEVSDYAMPYVLFYQKIDG